MFIYSIILSDLTNRRGDGQGGRKDRPTLSDFIGGSSGDNRDREPPPPRERGRGARRSRGRGRWNEPQDPDRPHRMEWSNSRNYIRNDNDTYNDNYDNAQDYNGHEYERKQDNRNNSDRRDYQSRSERGYGRSRQNYNTRNRGDGDRQDYRDRQRGKSPVTDQVLPSNYQKDYGYQPQESWSTADDDVVHTEPEEVYSVPQDFVIESRTHSQVVESETKAETSKPRETKSYSRERHQRSLKQEVPAAQGEQDVGVIPAGGEGLDKQIQALKITVMGSERKAAFISEEEALRIKMETRDVIQPQPLDSK